MEISEAYKNAFSEVYTILDYIEEEDYEKIPKEVLEVIEENRNLNYECEMNDEVDIYSQPMLPETRAILFNFYRDYWASPEQKEKIKSIQARELKRANERKERKFNSNVFEEQPQYVPVDKREALVEKKESHFKRFIDCLRKLFGK